jgi:hypothetical protein
MAALHPEVVEHPPLPFDQDSEQVTGDASMSSVRAGGETPIQST